MFAIVLGLWWGTRHDAPPIRIGVLHSLTGAMAVSEKPLVDAVRLAVESERLIGREKVSVLFACWTSACREAVKPVVEKHRHLMFYPVQYEGLEQSPNVLYTGSAPNQQIVPGTRWAMQQFGKRVYLVGSDYVFPRTANLIIRDLVDAADGVALAERYLPLGSADVEAVIEDIRLKRPNVIFNPLSGDSNASFFAALRKAGLDGIPLISFSVAEGEMCARGGGRLTRHYGVWSYFQSLAGEKNRRFIAAFRARFGADRVISDPLEAAYVGVHLWARAVQDAVSIEPRRVDQTLLRQTFSGTSGVAAVDGATRHLWKMVRVGKVQPDGQFEQVYASSAPLRPAPWPAYRSREAWQAMVEGARP